MNNEEFAYMLQDILMSDAAADYALDLDREVATVRTYREAGLLTSNEGVIVRLANGSEFQVTTVRTV